MVLRWKGSRESSQVWLQKDKQGKMRRLRNNFWSGGIFLTLVDELLACPLFYSLYAREVKKIASASSFLEVSKGDVIARGRHQGSLYVLLSGRVNLLIRSGSKTLKCRSLRAWGVAYEKLFDTTFARRCELEVISGAEIMQLPTENLFRLYHRSPKTYGIFMTNLMCQMFKDSNTANGLIAREFFAGKLRMRIPVYISEKRSLWSSRRRQNIRG